MRVTIGAALLVCGLLMILVLGGLLRRYGRRVPATRNEAIAFCGSLAVAGAGAVVLAPPLGVAVIVGVAVVTGQQMRKTSADSGAAAAKRQ